MDFRPDPSDTTPRPVFIVSDGTAITAENLAQAVLTQFPNLEYKQRRIPFVDTIEKAISTAHKINIAQEETGLRPIVFCTFSRKEIGEAFSDECTAYVAELFRSFVNPLEVEIGMQSAHSVGLTHKIRNEENYNRRISAIDYTLTHDDGQTDFGLDEAEVILVGVSRSGKTPTSLFLAMQFGIRVANYPLIPEDFDRGTLPPSLVPEKSRLFGLTIAPERLHEIRNERRPNSRYASLANCRAEVTACEEMLRRNGIPFLSSTSKSIEEIAATIIEKLHLEKHERIS